MFKIKLPIGVVVLAVTLGAVGASSASAEWFIEGEELPAGSKAALAVTAKVTEAAKLTAAGVTVECKGANLNGVNPEIIEPSRIAASSLTFSECKANANCTVSKTIGTVPVLAELAQEGTLQDRAVFAPETKTVFATTEFEGEVCALAGVQPIFGKATMTMPTGQKESASQVMQANTPAGELKLGSSPATLKGAAEIKLSTGEEFSEVGLAISLYEFGNKNSTELNFKNEAVGSKKEIVVLNPNQTRIEVGAKSLDELGNAMEGTNFKIVTPPNHGSDECKAGDTLLISDSCFVGVELLVKNKTSTFLIKWGGKTQANKTEKFAIKSE